MVFLKNTNLEIYQGMLDFLTFEWNFAIGEERKSYQKRLDTLKWFVILYLDLQRTMII